MHTQGPRIGINRGLVELVEDCQRSRTGFVRTASDSVKRLYGQMMARQPNFAERQPAFHQPEWQIEYEI